MSSHNVERDYGSYEEMLATFEFDDVYEETDWNAPDRLNFAHEAIDRHPPDDVAMEHVDADGTHRTFTFGDLSDRSGRFADVLGSLGVEQGDRVFTYLPRIPEHYAVFLGVLKAGAVFGAINERYGPDGIDYRLRDAGASTVVTTAAHAAEHGSLFEDVPSVENVVVVGDEDAVDDGHVHYSSRMVAASPEYETVATTGDDPAVLYYTSGTTGPSKGVVHTHGWLPGPASTVRYVLDLQSDDLYWSTGDMGWLTGPLHSLGAWFWGHSIFVYEGEFEVKAWLELLEDFPITVLLTVPTAYRSFVEHDDLVAGYDIDVRHAGSIGEPLNASTIEWGQDRLGVTIMDTYGLTESGADIVANLPSFEVRPGSMGKPMPGATVDVVDPEAGEPLEAGETGQIAWKGEIDCFFSEYWGDTADKADSYVNDWFLTGDLAHRDEDGYVWFEGRADDVILSSGYRIGPFEIENTLTDHEAVTEAAVVPEPDERRGNVVKAFVKLAPGYEPSDDLTQDIKDAVRENLAKHEYPRIIEYVDEFPKTVTGKIRRTELTERDA